MKYLRTLAILAVVGLISYACKKSFLDKRPLGALDPSALANKAGVNGLLIGAYSLLEGFGGAGNGWQSAASNWEYGGLCGGDAYKGSSLGDQPQMVPISTFKAEATVADFEQKWQFVYDGIARSNDVLRTLALATDISAADAANIEAQTRALRAWYHMEAKKMWNNIPFVDETITYADNNYFVPNDTDVWPKIEADLQFAVANLPVTQAEVGRFNKLNTEAVLAKAFMFQNKFAEAKPLLEDVINSGKYQLVKFHENFDIVSKNNKESVFAAQCSVNDGSSGNNGNWGDVLNFPYNGGPGGCCGFYQPSQFLVNHFRTDAAGLPFLDTYDAPANEVKSDMGLLSTQPFTPDAGFLDSRLDWTVGRRGLPYLDWGNYPGNDWIRQQSDGGPYAPIKNVYAKALQGKLTDASFWTSGVTANNVNLIRYADVLLWAAEVEIEVGTLEKARDYVNQVRARAADPAGWLYLADGVTPAANYHVGLYPGPWVSADFARKAVRFERCIELAMEGHRFFDIVRWGTADAELTEFFSHDGQIISYLLQGDFVPGKNEYFPIPQTAIDKSAGQLHQNPGYN